MTPDQLLLVFSVGNFEDFGPHSCGLIIDHSFPFEFLQFENSFDAWISFHRTIFLIFHVVEIQSNSVAMRIFPNEIEGQVKNRFSVFQLNR